MLDKYFNPKIKQVIDTLKFPMYIVVLDKSLRCTCLDNHGVPDVTCQKCLGTGYRAKIKKVSGVMEPDELTYREDGTTQKMRANFYYFAREDVPPNSMYAENLLVRDHSVDEIVNVEEYRSDSNRVLYYYVEAARKLQERYSFIDTFYKAIKGGRC